MQIITALTPQQVFDNALKGVRAQNYVVSKNARHSCAYRGAGGLRCGIGHSIPDDLYDKAMDAPASHITSIIRHFDSMHNLFKDCSKELLNKLQAAHDDIETSPIKSSGRNFERDMKEIAYMHGLNYTS